MNLQQRIALVILRWPWAPGQVPHGWDIQGQLQRQGGAFALAPIVTALEALAQQRAVRLSPPAPGGNRRILEAFPDRLREIVP